jgi:DNA-directed RNA polymerase subunit RPC12/RpoP
MQQLLITENIVSEDDIKPCLNCKGKGRRSYGLDDDDSKNTYKCPYCRSSGLFTKPDLEAIRTAIAGRKGLRSAKPKDNTEFGQRAAYVWRWARFHGGADVTMPCTVSAVGDPWRKELDLLVDRVAKEVYGTDKAAAYRWGRVLGLLTNEKPPVGLPASTYEDGPVSDGKDPVTNALLQQEKSDV